MESLNRLSSDTAEDRQPLEMMEHPTTGTSEEESSSLESCMCFVFLQVSSLSLKNALYD